MSASKCHRCQPPEIKILKHMYYKVNILYGNTYSYLIGIFLSETIEQDYNAPPPCIGFSYRFPVAETER